MPRMLALVALVLSVGTVTAYMFLLQRPIPIPLKPVWYLGALGLAVVLAVVAVIRARRRRWLPVTALVVSVLLLGLGGAFNFVLMRVPAGPVGAVAVGQPAPDFTLSDSAGHPVRLADYRGKKPVVLVFYRGYW